MSVRILIGDCREKLRELPDASVNCCVTSPPYFGLRDYGTAAWNGGDDGCDHVQMTTGMSDKNTLGPNGYLPETNAANVGRKQQYRSQCGKCGATRIDRQMGLEPTPDEFVAGMVGVFREVRRVLRDDGTLWLNIGDSYASQGGKNTTPHTGAIFADRARGQEVICRQKRMDRGAGRWGGGNNPAAGDIKPKDLIGIPWMLAKALRDPYYTGRIKRVEDRIWLAAMIDGEGCMFIHKRKAGTDSGARFTKADGTERSYSRTKDTFGAGLEVANCHRAIVERCLQITGVGSICEQTKDRRQTLYRWNLRSNECRWVVEEIYPHLVGKQHQARLLLGCPSSGEKADLAHRGMIDLHNGLTPAIDFAAPTSLYEPGWYLRQDIIWSKSNPMPESVRDRCTKAHEYLFLLSKGPRYYYDAEAIAEPASLNSHGGLAANPGWKATVTGSHSGSLGLTPSQRKPRDCVRCDGDGVIDGATCIECAGSGEIADNGTRNKRSVWEVATQPFSEAHFATFPPALIEPCILAGCPEGGTVLDPFFGAGTTGLVADRLGRNCIGIELNPEYAEIARQRLLKDCGLFADIAVEHTAPSTRAA